MKWMNVMVVAIIFGVVLWSVRGKGVSHDRAEVFHGAADASAVECLDDRWFILADDEDNLLRIYRRDLPDAPVQVVDMRPFLGLGGKNPETDIEGVARVGDHLFWISSHGRNAAGRTAVARHRFFATRLVVDGGSGKPQLVHEGRSVTNLLEVLENDPRLELFNLRLASGKAPKQAGGLNIEGLASTPAGTLLIGFRNPVPEGRALMVEMMNPMGVVGGEEPVLGMPRLLELGGLGIRGMTHAAGVYWILAGPVDGQGVVRIYRWLGGDDSPIPTTFESSSEFRWEGISSFRVEGVDHLMLVSDDGSMMVEGVENKRLKNPLAKTFRVLDLKLDEVMEGKQTGILAPHTSLESPRLAESSAGYLREDRNQP